MNECIYLFISSFLHEYIDNDEKFHIDFISNISSTTVDIFSESDNCVLYKLVNVFNVNVMTSTIMTSCMFDVIYLS